MNGLDINPASWSLLNPLPILAPSSQGAVAEVTKSVASSEQRFFGDPSESNSRDPRSVERPIVIKEARHAYLEMGKEFDRLAQEEIAPDDKYFDTCAEKGWRLIDQKENQAITQILDPDTDGVQMKRFSDCDAAARIRIIDIAVMLMQLRENKADTIICDRLERNLYTLISKDSLDHRSGFSASYKGNCYHEVEELEKSIVVVLDKQPGTKDFFKNILENEVMPVMRSHLRNKYPGITSSGWEKINGCHGLISRCGFAAVNRMKESFESHGQIRKGEFQSKVNQWRLAMHWIELGRSVEPSVSDKKQSISAPDGTPTSAPNGSNLPVTSAGQGYGPLTITQQANPLFTINLLSNGAGNTDNDVEVKRLEPINPLSTVGASYKSVSIPIPIPIHGGLIEQRANPFGEAEVMVNRVPLSGGEGPRVRSVDVETIADEAELVAFKDSVVNQARNAKEKISVSNKHQYIDQSVKTVEKIGKVSILSEGISQIRTLSPNELLRPFYRNEIFSFESIEGQEEFPKLGRSVSDHVLIQPMRIVGNPPVERRENGGSEIALYPLSEDFMLIDDADNRGGSARISVDDNQVSKSAVQKIERLYLSENGNKSADDKNRSLWGNVHFIHTSERQFLRKSSEISYRSWGSWEGTNTAQSTSTLERKAGTGFNTNHRLTSFQPISTTGRPIFKNGV